MLCGPIILKHLALHLKLLPLTKASLQKLLIVFVRCLVPLLMTQTVFYVNHWSMKKSHGSVLP